MKVANILKIVDIEYEQLSTELVKFLKDEASHTYADCIFEDHIYNSEDILEGIEDGGYDTTADVTSELETIAQLVRDNDCGYFRVTYQ